MILRSLSAYRDWGLLLLRAGLGAMMVLHGWPKIVGGPARWEQLGGAMAHLGIKFAPVAWGFLAASAETLGGALIVLGFFFRPATAALFFTMVVAATMRYRLSGGEFLDWAWPAELGIVFLGLFIIGPGRVSLDRS